MDPDGYVYTDGSGDRLEIWANDGQVFIKTTGYENGSTVIGLDATASIYLINYLSEQFNT